MKKIIKCLRDNQEIVEKDSVFFSKILLKIKEEAEKKPSIKSSIMEQLRGHKLYLNLAGFATAAILVFFLLNTFVLVNSSNSKFAVSGLSYDTASILYENNLYLIESAKQGSDDAKFELYNRIYEWISRNKDMSEDNNNEEYVDADTDTAIIEDRKDSNDSIRVKAFIYTEFLINEV